MNMTVDDKVFAQDLSQMRCAVSSQCETVRSTCTLNARCAPRNCRSQHRHWCRAW